ncbi:NADH-FMN oxidoreductase RutF, flavin reductase (DIM6/NTAB) family [Desulfotomaculum arcticum]|uniref:NADH-FMN oxidoreductase RutF, flavin reductase (DIM6/NTAB) family n=1 Tax=Desulfotruncus arcticus DSM 17038 TaxID=1121424 RepID=A0A1I2YIN3_9FIRM|nr:flavin reductase family protein [Desulfotruncus arcticus]SFH25189.1 NADH-FMN oxidoreductase RutF, flavin reductase (DIM6/NTAB) family [Desulfotomaculum arcticum] [Desulfotruncus arcticus DSM 17038]
MKKSLGAKTIAYPTPVFIIGSYDAEGRANVMTAAWGGICCSKPPCMCISLRKATYTYQNIISRKAYTINIPSEDLAFAADYFGLVSGKDEDKLVKAGLTAVKSDLVEAPYVKEFPMVIECKLIHTLEIGFHTQFIGEILDVKVDESAVDSKGIPKLDVVKPMVYAPEVGKYFGFGREVGAAFQMGKTIKER